MAYNSESKKISSLLDVGSITIFLIALFYTSGWSFASFYYSKFHLGLIGLNIPKEYLFIYVFWAIKDQPFLFVVFLLSDILLYFLLRFFFQKAKNAKNDKRKHNIFLAVGLFLIPIVIFLLFLECYHLGKYGASILYEKEALQNFQGYPRVKVWLKKEVADEMKEKAAEWEKGCYKLLLRNNEYLYLFKPGNSNPTDIIPQSDVEAVRVLPLYNKCEG